MSQPNSRRGVIDDFDRPMMERTRAVAPMPGSAIVLPSLGDSFSVKGHHLKLIQDNQFDGRANSDPHKHVSKFTSLCKMFKYGGNVTDDDVQLSLFPSSLTGEARAWFDELDEGTITTWNQLREEFVSRFFPLSLARKMLRDIKAFKQDEGESLVVAWKRLREMIRNCHGNGLSKDEIMEIFFYGLTKSSQKDLDLAGGGNFLYKTTNAVYKMMEDMVQASLARDVDDKDRDKKSRSTVASIESNPDDEVIHELKALSNRFSTIEDRLNIMDKDLKVIAHGCNKCGEMQYTEDCEEETTEQQRSNGQPEQPKAENEVKEDPIVKLTNMMEKYIDMNDKRHDSLDKYTRFLDEKISNLDHKVDTVTRDQQSAILGLEKKLEKMMALNARKENGVLPSNPRTNPLSNPNPSQKYMAYGGKMEAKWTKIQFWNLSRTTQRRWNHPPAPLVALQVTTSAAGSPQADHQCRSSVTSAVGEPCSSDSGQISISDGDLGTQLASKCKMKDGDNLGRSEKVQNPDTQNDEKRTSQANEDPGSFLIPCTINDEYFSSALADLGSSINVMPTAIFERLTLGSLKPANMSIRLADQTYRQPKGIVEQVHVRVKNLQFWTEFVVLDSIDGIDTPIILGRPFLHIADVTVHVLKREITLSDGKNVVKVSDLDSKLNIVKAECLSMEVGNDDQDGGKQTRKGKREGRISYECFRNFREKKEKVEEQLRNGREVANRIRKILGNMKWEERVAELERDKMNEVMAREPYGKFYGDPSIFQVPGHINSVCFENTYMNEVMASFRERVAELERDKMNEVMAREPYGKF
uniref:uncharacterized protein LOC122604335 n=1 Tax=Erigeron canadensis TaxID=72917 RepID=UPI001CB8E1CB|nr:uncharacterized protein LOC122604335 [Erigeron canadensis]